MKKRRQSARLVTLLGLTLQQSLCLAPTHPIAAVPDEAHRAAGRVDSDTEALSVRESANAPKPDQQRLDVTAYVLELDRWSAAAERLRTHPDEASALEKGLPRSWTVTLRGQNFSVPTDWLRKTLDSLRSDRASAAGYSKEIRDRLDGMRREAQAFERQPAVEPATARARLQAILSRRDFREAHGPTWWDRFRERIVYWIEDLITRIFGRLGNHPVAYRGIAWVIAVGLVVASMLWLLRILVRGRPGTHLDLRGPIQLPRTWRDWAREALSASARGDYREALHLAYWAGIYRLEELGVWQVDRARTPREYLRLLPREAGLSDGHKAAGSASSGPDRAALAAITARFERVWYGGDRASADDFQAVVAQLEILGCSLQSILPTGRS
jgi:hypothetical protein